MSENHLSVGSTCPPLQGGKLRLYSMKFCPYAHRVRLILEAKNVPHDIVNVNLKQKPEWLLEKNQDGKVPALETGEKVIVESQVIADYLNDTYPEPPLYPAEPGLKDKDKILIQKFDKVITATHNALGHKDDRTPQAYMEDILAGLDEFESELAQRGTTFFGGEKPGMVDYMLWPWSERSKLPAMLGGEEFKPPKDRYPKLVSWRNSLKENEAVKHAAVSIDKHYQFMKTYLAGEPDYEI